MFRGQRQPMVFSTRDCRGRVGVRKLGRQVVRRSRSLSSMTRSHVPGAAQGVVGTLGRTRSSDQARTARKSASTLVGLEQVVHVAVEVRDVCAQQDSVSRQFRGQRGGPPETRLPWSGQRQPSRSRWARMFRATPRPGSISAKQTARPAGGSTIAQIPRSVSLTRGYRAASIHGPMQRKQFVGWRGMRTWAVQTPSSAKSSP